MKNIRKLHLYLGTLFAPILIFLALTGAFQTFGLHDAAKDNSYVPPAWVAAFAQIHKNQRVEATEKHSLALQTFFLLASVGMIITSGLGIYMAFKYTKKHLFVYLALAFGVLLPIVFLFI